MICKDLFPVQRFLNEQLTRYRVNVTRNPSYLQANKANCTSVIKVTCMTALSLRPARVILFHMVTPHTPD